MKASLLPFCFLLCFGITSASATTIVEQRISATRRLLPLKKLTIGPDDQYHGVIDLGKDRLIFTQKADLVSHLKVQDLITGEAKDLLPLTADSQEPAVSGHGLIAFTYYKFNARGDICYIQSPSKLTAPVDDSKITCLKRSTDENDTERATPFWKSDEDIGFTVRDIQNRIWKIVTQNLKTGKIETLAEGKVWSPAMKAGGKYLVFDRITEFDHQPKRSLVLKELATQKEKTIHFSIPGISGFPFISEDEQYLYFSHYLNDTNQDNVIDGSDNGVVFRIPVQAVLASKDDEPLFPEQLTSVESSCSFPRSDQDQLYVTCAFEGNLDVYQLPTSGIIPKEWTLSILENALQTSRSYPDRILALNTLHYRFGGAAQTEKLLTNHVLADDPSAARFYLAQLTARSAPKDKAYYQSLDLYLQARELKKGQTTEDATRDFQNQMMRLESKLNSISGEENLKKIIKGFMHFFLDQNKVAVTYLQQVHLAQPHPLERFLNFELTSRIQPTLESYRAMMLAPELSEESKLYYAFEALHWVQTQHSALNDRIRSIESIHHGLSAPIATLLTSEIVSLKLIRQTTEAMKTSYYADLDKLMSESRNDYFLRKAMYIRAILNFAVAGEFKFLSYIASNWLRYTINGDTEFIYAREVFSNSALDQAYDYLGKKKFDVAASFFYESLSLTDDLESHDGYIKAMMQTNQRSALNDRYANLKQRQFIDDHLKFVEALLRLVDQPQEAKSYDFAIERIEAMQEDRNAPVRYLLLGYARLVKLLKSGSGIDFDQALFQDANRDLMLAYDLGRDNERIKASALMNLGILHQRVQNAGLSTRFFKLRKALPFITPEDQTQFSWLYAKSLFYSRSPDEAAAELETIPANLKSAAVLERQGFYFMASGKYKTSADRYQNLLQRNQIQGSLNLAKAHLNLGLSRVKLHDSESAHAELKQSIALLATIQPEPKAIQMVAYGLLAQVSVGTERTDALEKRGTLLAGAKASLDEWLPTVIQNRLQRGEAYSQSQNFPLAIQNLKEALRLADDYGKANQYFGSAVFHTASNYLGYALLHPEKYSAEDSSSIQDFMTQTLKAYQSQKVSPPVLDFQKLKLEVLWAAYRKRVMHISLPAGEEVSSLLSSELAKKVQEDSPSVWGEIETLGKRLQN